MCDPMDGATRTDLILHCPLSLYMILLQLFAKFLQSFQVFDRNPHFLNFLWIRISMMNRSFSGQLLPLQA